jgi:hypothetical protein
MHFTFRDDNTRVLQQATVVALNYKTNEIGRRFIVATTVAWF